MKNYGQKCINMVYLQWFYTKKAETKERGVPLV